MTLALTPGLFQSLLSRSLFILLFALSFHKPTEAQLQRERADTGPHFVDIFHAPSSAGLTTVHFTPRRNLNSSVMHTFGLVKGGINQFYGLDNGANTRIGLDYGISENLSIGIGRMTFNKVVDLNSKFSIMKQTADNRNPLSISIKLSSAISTLPGIRFSDRLNYFTSLMLARKLRRFSFQISPMLAHFQHVDTSGYNRLYGLGMIAAYQFSERFSFSSELLPVIGHRNPGTHTTLSLSFNIDTGGHLFQLFFTSSQWHNEQYIMANNRDRFWDGEFRFGFNIHRVFGI